ncbi:MAG: T9SS type A sorting domain-containing protein [Chitinophagaceae bacterium]
MKMKLLPFCLLCCAFASPGILFAQASSNSITVAVTFSSNPSTASAAFTDLKYNKQGVFNYEMDDRSAGMRDVFAFFNGGTAPVNSISYPGKTFTDGCGNPIKWRAAVATNALLQSNNSDWVNYNNCLNWTEMANLVNNSWAIENHGFYHNKTGTYANGENTNKNINDNTTYIRERLQEQGVQYVPRVMVVPNNDAGYVPRAEALGYLAAASQGALDGYTIYPQSVDNTLSISSLPQGFAMYNRGLKDGWDAGTVGYYQGIINNNFLGGMSASNKKMWRFAGHYFSAPDFDKFVTLMNYLETEAADRVWMTTLQEFLEYRETKAMVVKTESISGNTLTITLDLSSLPANNRFRDMSLLVTANTSISSVVVTGADASSFNAATGLINVFEKQNAPLLSLPVILHGFSAQRNNNAVNLKWNASVSAATDFTVERSTNGIDFTATGTIRTTSAGTQTHSFKDATPLEGNNSYRIKMHEEGQAPRYSAIVLVRFSALDKTVIYPNPLKGRTVSVTLAGSLVGVADLWVTNTSGSVVHQQKIQVGSGRQIKINLPSAIPPGTYILELAGGGNLKESMMIVCL